MNEAKANSVRNLENLYTVVVGLGLSLAIYNFIDTTQKPVPVKLESVPFFLAFLVTLIPFYHGALRHLDITYVERGGRQVRSGALLADFIILFIESCLFLGLAVLLSTPQFFAWGLVILLTVDAIWGFAAHIGFSQEVKPKAEVRWAFINFIATVVLVVYLVMSDVWPSKVGTTATKLGIFVVAVSFVRTVIDYSACWNFYYPPAEKTE